MVKITNKKTGQSVIVKKKPAPPKKGKGNRYA